MKLLFEFLFENIEEIKNVFLEGNSLRKNKKFNDLKTVEELTELTELIIKRINKGKEKVKLIDIEKEIAGVFIQLIGYIGINSLNVENILEEMKNKKEQIKNKNKRLKETTNNE